MQCGYSLDAELNSTSNELSRLEFEKKHREICRKYEQKSIFVHSSSKINNYYFIIFLKRPILDLKFPLMLYLWESFISSLFFAYTSFTVIFSLYECVVFITHTKPLCDLSFGTGVVTKLSMVVLVLGLLLCWFGLPW